MLIALSLQVLSPSLLPTAQAGSTTLCSGFADCNRKGMGAHGYHAVWHKMFWRMFPYRNCVNYVAFKVIQDGGPTSRPWSGSGNATNWGYAMSRITDQRPTKGSVAWWKAYDGGVSRYGHVAYVERVVSSREIIVSESNYGSDFSRRRITKSGGSWPTGFIHFTDRQKQPIRNVVRPHLAGQAVVGKTVWIKGGKWSPVAKPSYRWYADGKPIPGARSKERHLKIGPYMAGKKIRAKVIASKRGHRTESILTPAVTPKRAKLDYRRPPAITGYPEVGGTLRVKPGVFFPRGGQRTFQWYVDGEAINGATGKTFTPTRAQLRGDLRVKQRVEIHGYRPMNRWSAPVGQVMAPEVALRRAGSVTGSPVVGETLRVDPGAAVKDRAWTQIQWRRNGKAIPGANGRSYTLTRADLGERVTARVRWKLKRFRNTDRVYGVGSTIKAPATIHLRTKGPKAGRGVAIVRVTAPGADVKGRVTVQIGRFEKTEWLSANRGYAWIGFDGMTHGKKGVRVTFHGSRLVTSDRATDTVWVR